MYCTLQTLYKAVWLPCIDLRKENENVIFIFSGIIFMYVIKH